MADIKAQQIEILGYKLTKDPKPGAKVMHAVEAIDTVAYGLTTRMEYHMAHSARTTDLFTAALGGAATNGRSLDFRSRGKGGEMGLRLVGTPPGVNKRASTCNIHLLSRDRTIDSRRGTACCGGVS